MPAHHHGGGSSHPHSHSHSHAHPHSHTHAHSHSYHPTAHFSHHYGHPHYSRSYYTGYTGGYRNFVSGGLITLIVALAASFIILPLVLSTDSFLTASSLVAGSSSSAVITAATLGFGALAIYASIGLAYLYSGAHEAYHSNKGIFNILKSRVANEHGLSFRGVISAMGAFLWAPFLMIGAVSGKAVKAIVSACSSKKTQEDPIHLDDFSEHNPLSGLGKGASNDYDNEYDLPPSYSSSKGTSFFSRCCGGKNDIEAPSAQYQR